MMQGYIVYYEGISADGVMIGNGNSSIDVDYSQEVTSKEIFDFLERVLLEDAKKENEHVVRVVVKGFFKL